MTDREVQIVSSILGWTSYLGATALFAAFVAWAGWEIIHSDRPLMRVSLVMILIFMVPFWLWVSSALWRSRGEDHWQ